MNRAENFRDGQTNMSNRTFPNGNPCHAGGFSMFRSSPFVCKILIACLGIGLWAFRSNAGSFPMDWRSLGVADGLGSNQILSLTATPEQILIGTSQGLSVLNKKTNKITLFPEMDRLPGKEIRVLFRDENRVWLGTDRGLACLEDGHAQLLPHGLQVGNLPINTLAKKSDMLYVGTAEGVFRYQIKNRQETIIPELAGKNVTALKIDDDGLLISLANGVVNFYNTQANALQPITVELNPLQHSIRAIGAGGDFFWLATDGSGVIQYDKMRSSWTPLPQSNEIDRFLTALAEDGNYLWFGTFYGLYRFQISTQSWETFEHPVFTDHPLSALLVDAEQIWIGTEGGGIIYGSKKFPHLSAKLTQRFFNLEDAVIPIEASGTNPLQLQCNYNSLTFPNIQLTQFTRLQPSAQGYDLHIAFSDMPEDFYKFKLSLADPLGNQNEESFTLAKESKPLSVEFQIPADLHAGNHVIQGTYSANSISKILINPGNVPADLDRNSKKFSARITLAPEDKKISAMVFHLAGYNKFFYQDIAVKPLPELGVYTALTFTPGTGTVNFALKMSPAEEIKDWQLNIRNSDDILVRRFSGEKTLPNEISWDGIDEIGDLVETGSKFEASLKITTTDGVEVASSEQPVISSVVLVKQSKGLVIKLSSSFLFGKGLAEVNPDCLPLFEEVAKLLNEHPKSQVLIEGHTDNTPIRALKYSTNLVLSEARALNVADYLTKKLGIEEKRLVIKGYGDTRPIAPNQNEPGRAKNRRVEIVILEK